MCAKIDSNSQYNVVCFQHFCKRWHRGVKVNSECNASMQKHGLRALNQALASVYNLIVQVCNYVRKLHIYARKQAAIIRNTVAITWFTVQLCEPFQPGSISSQTFIQVLLKD